MTAPGPIAFQALSVQKLLAPWILAKADFMGVDEPTHRAIVLQYTLWYCMNVTVWLSIVCGSHSDWEPDRARDWRHYLEAIGSLK